MWVHQRFLGDGVGASVYRAPLYTEFRAGVVKLADAPDSKSGGLNARVGSIPSSGTNFPMNYADQVLRAWARLFDCSNFVVLAPGASTCGALRATWRPPEDLSQKSRCTCRRSRVSCGRTPSSPRFHSPSTASVYLRCLSGSLFRSGCHHLSSSLDHSRRCLARNSPETK
jgi:hypothetical protein